ncbi:MAG TPA: hypothetical protein VD927_02790 [Chryseosolibacter sp.]|nr:hypothetical protein [Chryseosolibacter sp.]
MKQTLLLLIFSVTICKAQFTTEFNPLTITGNASNWKTEIPLASPKTLGSSYLTESWLPGQIILRNKHRLPPLSIRIEIEQELIEVKSENSIKYVNLRDVNKVIMTGALQGHDVVENGANYSIDGTPISGVVITDTTSSMKVVKHLYIEILPANYNVAMDVGSRDNRKMLREHLYLANGNDLISCRLSTRKILPKLGSYEQKARAILKSHRLNLSKERDLKQFLTLLKA